MGKLGTQKFRSDGIEKAWYKAERDAQKISEAYGISRGHVYQMLKDYCEETGHVYDDFLRQPHRPPTQYIRKLISKERKKTCDSDESSFEIEYISELLKSSDINDTIEAANLMEHLIKKIMEE